MSSTASDRPPDGPRVHHLTIESVSPVVFGGQLAGGDASVTTWTLERPDGSRAALVPGSSIRGVLRHVSRRFAAARGEPCDGTHVCGCVTCRLFGNEGSPGLIHLRTGAVEDPGLHTVHRVAIDRRRRSAANQALWSVTGFAGTVTVELTEAAPLAPSDAEHLRALLGWLEATGLAVGRHRATRTPARVRVVSAPRPTPAVPAPEADDAPRWHVLEATALEPLRLGALKERPFFHRGLDRIPSVTLAGALGWALTRAGASGAASDLFGDGSDPAVRIGDGLPAVGGPLRTSLRECRSCGRLTDAAVTITAAALAGRDPACTDCGGGLRPWAPTVPTVVSGHTAIDPGRSSAATGQLYQRQLIAPGARFAAWLHCGPGAAGTLSSLGEVLVGGGRARGTGRTRLEITGAPHGGDGAARVAATTEAVRSAGADPAGAVAIVEIPATSWLPVGLRRVLADLGAEIVTGEVTRTPAGGWDERAGRMRPLREAIAGGSWVAVTGTAEALAALDGWTAAGTDVADPEGSHHLWLRVGAPTITVGSGTHLKEAT